MEDNKLLAIFVGCGALIAIVGIIATSITEKTPHERRMEHIEEMRALSELKTTAERHQLVKDIDSMIHVVDREIETN